MVHDAGTSRDRIVFLGHSTVLIELDGVALLTDPLLRHRVAHLRRQVPPAALEIARHADAVLISHLHHDHLDPASLRLLGRSLPVVVPQGAGRWLRRRGFTGVSELSVGQTLQIGPVRVAAVRAHHDDRRHPGGPAAQSVGYLLHASRTVYFAGDTELFEAMSGLSPEIDVALLPVAGWGPKLGAGHMNARDAARATQLLKPRVAIPIHWGTLLPLGLGRRHRARLADPAREFARETARASPGTEVRILVPGDETSM
ncbi:MAG TPA: MBL fold metallo-hydrolase [Solirubrobacteraceae bacterium]|jgi:L-ascorbate metabolism protein UlaG (beta-lactamase superfamily)|nr:MBL fold metallo-hydrolase [Solirubrobacteraceae bacterium]